MATRHVMTAAASVRWLIINGLIGLAVRMIPRGPKQCEEGVWTLDAWAYNFKNPCDTCGNRSKWIVIDVVDETCPGDEWETAAPSGIRRAGCKRHPVEGRRYKPRDLPLGAPYWAQRKPEVLAKLRKHGLTHG